MILLKEPLTSYWQNKNIWAEVPTISGEVFRQVANRRTLSFSIQDQRFFIKIHQGVGWGEIIKNLLTLKKPILSAENEWLAINKLNELDIDCPDVVGFGIKGKNPAAIQSFIITKALEQTTSLEDFCANWLTKKPSLLIKNKLIDTVAKISRIMHQHHVYHRDFYLCHFLMDINYFDKDEIKLYLIDLHRTLILNRQKKRWQIKDLAGLYFSAMDIGLTKKDILRFIKRYTQKSLKHELTKHLDFWKVIENKAIKLYVKAHDKVPPISHVGH